MGLNWESLLFIRYDHYGQNERWYVREWEFDDLRLQSASRDCEIVPPAKTNDANEPLEDFQGCASNSLNFPYTLLKKMKTSLTTVDKSSVSRSAYTTANAFLGDWSGSAASAVSFCRGSKQPEDQVEALGDPKIIPVLGWRVKQYKAMVQLCVHHFSSSFRKPTFGMIQRELGWTGVFWKNRCDTKPGISCKILSGITASFDSRRCLAGSWKCSFGFGNISYESCSIW